MTDVEEYRNAEYQPGFEEEPEPTYTIRRFFQNKANEIIETGLSLEDAQAHCQDPDSSSSTATAPEMVAITEVFGEWFDGYDKEE